MYQVNLIARLILVIDKSCAYSQQPQHYLFLLSDSYCRQRNYYYYHYYYYYYYYYYDYCN